MGHGTSTTEQLLAGLRRAQVQVLVDIRRFPSSSRHPHLSKGPLAAALQAAGLRYRWEPRLGGRRRLPQGEPVLDTWWTVEAFRAYAAHTRTREFAAALDEVLVEAAGEDVCVLCSETVWWRCHRRLVADVVVLQRRTEVLHVMPSGLVPHRPSAGARVRADGQVVWDGAGSSGEAAAGAQPS